MSEIRIRSLTQDERVSYMFRIEGRERARYDQDLARGVRRQVAGHRRRHPR